jgi:hypothetical protein
VNKLPIAALKNPHLAIPFIIIIVSGISVHVAGVFLPNLKSQFKEVEDYLQKILLMYSSLAAALTGPASSPPSTSPTDLPAAGVPPKQP